MLPARNPTLNVTGTAVNAANHHTPAWDTTLFAGALRACHLVMTAGSLAGVPNGE